MSRFRWVWAQLTRRLWLRAALFSLLGGATALAALVLKPLIPADMSVRVGADAVDNILGIMASSMLAVTTFSLGAMVAAYSAAASSVTPRATTLLIEDTTAQNALSAFIGTFLFSIVGIVALSTGVYGGSGRVVLFAVTVLVIAFALVTLLRWIEYLSQLGRLGETTKRVEDVAIKALLERCERPNLGAMPPPDQPETGEALNAPSTGYLQHIDVEALEGLAGKGGGRIDILVLPGAFVTPARAIARIVGLAADDRLRAAVRKAFAFGDQRTFDLDPRFGLIVLAEIASRSLSSAINDSGTAIDVIGRGVRVLSVWAQRPPDTAPPFRNVTAPGLETGDLMDDFFLPIARDGAALVEVQLRLQKALADLARIGDAEMAQHAARHSEIALRRSRLAMDLPDDIAAVEEAAGSLSQARIRL